MLNEIDSAARLDYYQEDQANWGTFPTIYKNLPALIKDQTNPALSLEITGKPLSIETFTNRDPVNTANKYWLYINTTASTEKINITDGFLWNKVKYLFANETVIGEPKRAEVLLPTSGGTSYAFADGNLYLYNYAILSYYGTPINKTGATGITFKIAPYFASPVTAYMHNIFFDADNRRFVRTSSNSSGASIISTPTQAFDLQYVAKDLVWLGFTRAFNGQAVAVLKDGGQYYLARIAFSYTASSPTITAISIENLTTFLTGIANADRFVLDQQYGYLFYSVGSKLYQYDMDNKILKEAYDFGTRKISMLKVNRLMTAYTVTGRFAAPGYAIIVATYDAAAPNTTGQVEFFKAPELLGALTKYQEPFTGLGKVVDVKYSELSN
ncbi:hypothetical protein [Niabella hibiscisoli]|uniref:hypothetical protein n=1 Tax=Niabella hibiscisoli TaxID=1825928 RepID=UPI001F10C379|nr:hypothetical protein [Niabella hibiscisoli]MCH5719798.1 hypothetical protein [Niabella hibiscisoli]